MRVTLNDVIRVHYGKSLKAEDRDESGASPVYGSSGVIGRHNSKLIDYPTLIIGRKGSVGAVTFAPDGGWPIDTTFYTEIVKPGEVDLKYLYYAIHNADLERHTITTSIPGLSREDIYKTKIYLPPLAEQRRIAAILDTVDALREKRRQIIAKYDTLLRAVFLQMFGDPVKNPKGWPVIRLGDSLTYLTSGSRGWAKYYSDKGSRFLRIQNVGRNRLFLNDMAYVKAPDGAEARRTKVEPGDVLLSITADLGRTCVIPPDIGDAYINQHLAILRVKDIQPSFLSAFIASRGGQLQIASLDKGGVKAGLNFDDIRSLKIPLPSPELQGKYSIFERRVFDTQRKLKLSEEKLEILFRALQQRAFTSKLFAEKASAAHHEFSAD